MDAGEKPKSKPKAKASSDPNDLSAFNMDEYDNEESKGVGMFLPPRASLRPH
jgi:periodic tryptophan protein 1